MRAGIGTKNNVYKLYDMEAGEALDGTVTIELPNFELSSDTFTGAGLAAEINVPAPGVMAAMTVVLSCPVIYGPLIKFLALGKTRTLDLRNEIMVNRTDNHAQEKVPNRWILKGPVTGSNPGSVEQAAAGDAQLTMQVYYCHHWLDGDDILEWDPFKYIYTVNGEDLMAVTRQNILVD